MSRKTLSTLASTIGLIMSLSSAWAGARTQPAYLGTCASTIEFTYRNWNPNQPFIYYSIVQYTDENGGDCIGGHDRAGLKTFYKIVFSDATSYPTGDQAKAAATQTIQQLEEIGYCRTGEAPRLDPDAEEGGRLYIRGLDFRGLDGASPGAVPGWPL